MKREPAGEQPGTRLNKYIAQAGITSRRGADQLIAGGKVRVNGKSVRELGTIVRAGDRVDVSGTLVKVNDEPVYLVAHKPPAMVTTMRDPEGRRTVADLVPRGMPRMFPVGRLDYGTSGVLLLTNDGDLSNRLLHPKFGVEKTYRATIAGRLSADQVRYLNEGVEAAAFRAAGAKVRVVAARRDHSIIDLTIHEGRNRQVRRMFEALGHDVLQLVRLRFGPIALGDLTVGQTRPLLARELTALKRVKSEQP
ncbi:MAG: pseudouridine synthase [Vulcanimicrobiaceae bacterium]